MKKHSKALVFFAVSEQIPIVYSADRGSSGNKIHGVRYIPTAKAMKLGQ